MHRILYLRNQVARLDRRGFSRIGALCLLALAFIALMVIGQELTVIHGDKPLAASLQIASFTTALDAFRDDTGFYPTGANGLQDLIRQPIGVTNWCGPYLMEIPKDPWGQDYIYECPGKHTASGYPYDIFSVEPKPGTNVILNYLSPWLRPGLARQTN
jgi:general secretion pathway protein G